MAWQNAFDDGPCTVTVTRSDAYPEGANPVVVYTGSLSKGDSVTFTDAKFSGKTFTLAVDAAGRVKLSFDGTYFGGYGFAADVAPADMSNVTGGRISDVNQFLDTNGYPEGVQYLRGDGVDVTKLSNGGP